MSQLAGVIPTHRAAGAAVTAAPPAIEVAEVVKRYAGQPALKGITLRVEPGSTVALVGPNGAGKTTLLNVIAGLRVATAGRVRIHGGIGGDDRRRHASRLGVLTHQTWLYDRLTVRENLTLHARLRGLGDERVDELLAASGLTDVADRQAGACSHGLRKRVSLARMLLHDPDVLVLDEPFSGLDVTAQERLGRLLEGSRGARTILFSTHELARADVHASRTLGLDEGSLVADEDRGRAAGAQLIARTRALVPPTTTRSGLRAFLATVWTLLGKDLLIEARSRAISSALVVFTGLVALTLMIAFEPFAADPRATGGVLWVLLTFGALHGLSRGFDEDFRDGGLHGLRTTGCEPAAMYVARVAGTSLLLVGVGLVGTLLVAAAFEAPALVQQLPRLLLVLALAGVGLSAVGAILTVIARHSRMGETLLPIFMLPLSVPVLLAGIETLPWLLTTGTLDWSWIQILVIYDAAMLTAGALFFAATLEE